MELEIMEQNRLENNRKESFNREEAYLRAEKRLKEIKGFYWHAFWYVVVNIFIIFVLGSNSDGFMYFGKFSTAFFWGIGLAFHALGVFGKNLLFSKSWEKRKIEEYMQKDKKRWE